MKFVLHPKNQCVSFEIFQSCMFDVSLKQIEFCRLNQDFESLSI